MTAIASAFPLAPDQWCFAALILIGIVLAVGYRTGDVNRERRERAAALRHACPACGGTGRQVGRECAACSGTGRKWSVGLDIDPESIWSK